MSEGTQFINKPGGDDSRIWGVSLRGWITLLLVTTVCIMALSTIEVKEPLYTMAVAAVSFYFGQKTQTKNP